MTPEDTARHAAETMWAADSASRTLGMELLQVMPGRALLAMVVRPDMVNGHNLAHGGFIFTLADSAFAFACNSHGITTVAAHCAITFLRPARLGDRLVAEARTITEGGRSGLTDVTVRVGTTVIAEFRGYSRSLGTSFLPEAAHQGE
jgi:acyl-CoA thioesterase